jgi:hypothetical protein
VCPYYFVILFSGIGASSRHDQVNFGGYSIQMAVTRMALARLA